jgi:hypothetical protein
MCTTKDSGRSGSYPSAVISARCEARKAALLSQISALSNPHRLRIPKAQYAPEKLASVADKLSESVDEDYLGVRSKFTPWNRSPAGFLAKLYRAGERVIVFDDYYSQGQKIWVHPGLTGDFSVLNNFQKRHGNVWFLIQPVDGEYHWNPRGDPPHMSRRSEESVTSWRYMLLESDEAPRDLWLKALVRLPLPIASVVDTGKRGFHALVRIETRSKAEWDHIVGNELFGPLKVLGADKGATHAVQLSRLANCMRGETRRLQKLLYLDDTPDRIPICEKPTHREPASISESQSPRAYE